MFPAGIVAGCCMGRGQDAAGRGLGIGIGLFGTWIIGGTASAFLVSRLALRSVPSRTLGGLIAFSPWIIWAGLLYTMIFTRLGDQLLLSLEDYATR